MNTRHTLCLAAVLVLAGCKKDAPPPAPTANVVTVHATNYAFSAPDSIPSGLTTIQLVNGGPALHHLQLMRIDSGRTFDSLVAALRNPGPPPRWIYLVAGPNTPQPGDTTWLTTTLAPGHYALICLIPDSTMTPHFAHGMMRPLEVTAASGPALAEPVADVEMRLGDYSFTESAPLTAGRHTIKLINDGAQPHEVLVVRLDSNTTVEQVATWGERGLRGPQPASRAMGGTSGIMPGDHTFITLTLAPGRYGLICFFPDGGDGKSHWIHGMIKEVRVM